ncbi:uncharacterized protein METZ01_LOCUS482296, partial [marine metagenome]
MVYSLKKYHYIFNHFSNKEAIMATEILIKHTESGLTKKGFYGFSWTYFFFGWLVPIFRGETSTGFLHLLLYIITFGIYHIFG